MRPTRLRACTNLFTTSPFASCLPGCLASRRISSAAADSRLSGGRLRHRAVRDGMGQVAGLDQYHLRARPDLHAVHDRARDRPEEDHPCRPRDSVCCRRPVDRRVRARCGFLCCDRLVTRRGQVRCGLSDGCLRAVQHGDHRQGTVRETRTRYPPGPHHPRCTGAAGYLRDPVPSGPAKPRGSTDQHHSDVDRPGLPFGRHRAGSQPICAAEIVSSGGAPAGTRDAGCIGLVLPHRRDRGASASVPRNGFAGGRGFAVHIPVCARCDG